jgi:hypothetical protein
MRPVYNEVSTAKAKSEYEDAYGNTDDLLKSMKEAKSKKTGTLGLWPLDAHSYNDWRTTSHVKKVFTDYIVMARIEISIVNSYRPALIQNCPAAAFIRVSLASLLSDVCNIRAWSGINPDTNQREKRQVRRFIYADKITCDLPSAPQPPPVDVLDLKLKRQRASRSKALAADAVAILKKVEALRAAAATPKGKELDRTVAKAVKSLKNVCLHFSFRYKLIPMFRLFATISLVSLVWKRPWKTIPLPP